MPPRPARLRSKCPGRTPTPCRRRTPVGLIVGQSPRKEVSGLVHVLRSGAGVRQGAEHVPSQVDAGLRAGGAVGARERLELVRARLEPAWSPRENAFAPHRRSAIWCDANASMKGRCSSVTCDKSRSNFRRRPLLGRQSSARFPWPAARSRHDIQTPSVRGEGPPGC